MAIPRLVQTDLEVEGYSRPTFHSDYACALLDSAAL